MGTTLRKLAALTATGIMVAGPVSISSASINPASINPASINPVASAYPNRGDWATWQGDKAGSRHNPSEYRINPANVGELELKWAFAYEKTGVVAKSQPAVAGGDIFFGGPDMKFHALDAKSGRTKWTFDLASVDPAVGIVLDGPAVAKGKVFFGDSRGYLYALDQKTGKLVWAKDTEPHPQGYSHEFAAVPRRPDLRRRVQRGERGRQGLSVLHVPWPHRFVRCRDR